MYQAAGGNINLEMLLQLKLPDMMGNISNHLLYIFNVNTSVSRIIWVVRVATCSLLAGHVLFWGHIWALGGVHSSIQIFGSYIQLSMYLLHVT